jgi:hypothetical protein
MNTTRFSTQLTVGDSLDPSLILTRKQHPAMVGNAGNRKFLSYTEFANHRNAQQPLTAHSK